jgi:hypothetical protein
MTKAVLSILPQAVEPLTSRDIARELLVSRALDKDDQKLLALMTKRRWRHPSATTGQRCCVIVKRAGTVYRLGNFPLNRSARAQG